MTEQAVMDLTGRIIELMYTGINDITDDNFEAMNIAGSIIATMMADFTKDCFPPERYSDNLRAIMSIALDHLTAAEKVTVN